MELATKISGRLSIQRHKFLYIQDRIFRFVSFRILTSIGILRFDTSFYAIQHDTLSRFTNNFIFMLNHIKLFHILDCGICFDFCIRLKIPKIREMSSSFGLQNCGVSHTTIITIFSQGARSTLSRFLVDIIKISLF